MFKGLPNCIKIVTDYGLAQKLKLLPQLNKLNKRFNKINENVGVNQAPIRIRHSGRAGLGGRYTLVVSEPRFRRFWKKALNDFEKDFENGI